MISKAKSSIAYQQICLTSCSKNTVKVLLWPADMRTSGGCQFCVSQNE